MTAALLLLAGLALLTAGAELLVRGASALAAAARIPPLVIGLTVVAYGTSTPELVVSLQAAWRGQADISLGNVIGSNIFNVLFILGLSALITPLAVAQRLVRLDVPLLIGLSALVWVLGRDGVLGRADGLALSGGLVLYTVWSIVQSRRESGFVKQEYAQEFGPPAAGETAARALLQTAQVLAGLALLVLGSRWFVGGAVPVARALEVSELVIGLTIVAAGTSLPEVATSILAAVRGERDIAVGNVVGSNIFNILGVLGVSSLASGVRVPEAAIRFDLPVMIAAAAACLPVFFTGNRIARWEGGLFLGYYVAYAAWLVLSNTEPALARTLGAAVIFFAAPLTAAALLAGVIRKLREGAGER